MGTGEKPRAMRLRASLGAPSFLRSARRGAETFRSEDLRVILRKQAAAGLSYGPVSQKQGAIRVERSWYKGSINPTKTNEIRIVGDDDDIFERLEAWIETLPDRASSGWLFPSERIVTPLLSDNILRRSVYPRLESFGLDRINFAVLRRSHSSLHEEKGTHAKIIADQQGHGLGVHLSDYVDSSIAIKREAASALWADFKKLKSSSAIPN